MNAPPPPFTDHQTRHRQWLGVARSAYRFVRTDSRPAFVFLRRPLFLYIVLIPNLISLLYFGLIASPIYASRASLTIFNPSATSSSLSSVLSGGSGDGTSESAFILKDYIESWDEFHKLDQRLDLASHYRLGDFFGRYGGILEGFEANDVALWHYYQDNVVASVDVKSGIASVTVLGYSPAFTQNLADALLQDTREHLNVMSLQQQQDMIASTEGRKAVLEKAIQNDNAALAAYRATIGTYDPKEQYLSNLSLVNALTAKKAEFQSQYSAIAAATPNSPDARNLIAAMGAIQSKITGTTRQIAALEGASSRYDALVTHRDNDVALLQQVSILAQEAGQKAAQSRYYLNVISSPSAPQTPELPHRLWWIGGVLLCSILLWGLLR